MTNNETIDSKTVLITYMSVLGISLAIRGVSYYIQKNKKLDVVKHGILTTDSTQPKKSDYVSSISTESIVEPAKASHFTVKKGAVQIPLHMIECPKGSYRFETFTNASTPQYQTQTKQVSFNKPFLLSAHEITQSFYTFIKANNPSRSSQVSNAPVDNISWFDAIDFCNQLSIQSNLEPCYKIKNVKMQDTERDGTKTIPFIVNADVEWDRSANGFRLPTEEEWQYAAIANSKFQYIGSDLADECCWYKGNSLDKTQPVGMKKPNAWGLYDMGGNVSEFCWDAVDTGHIVKGGSFISPKEHLFASPSFRNMGFRSGSIGFRIAKNI